MKEGNIIYRGYIDTPSFSFEGFSSVDAFSAQKAGYRAWLRHVKQCQRTTPPQQWPDRTYVRLADVCVDDIELGCSYRDHEKIE